MTNSKMNIYQKIVEIKANIKTFAKDNTGYKYTYVSGTQVLGKIKDKMDELGVILQPSIKTTKPYSKHEYKNNKGETKIEFVVEGDMEYCWINADNPDDRFTIPWYYIGMQDDPSKALGSGLTYAERYFLLKSFGIPTDEVDPDKRQEEDNNTNSVDTTICPKCGGNKKTNFPLCYLCGEAEKRGIKREIPTKSFAPPQTPKKTVNDSNTDLNDKIEKMSRDELLYEIKTNFEKSIVPELKSRFRQEISKTQRYHEDKFNKSINTVDDLEDNQLKNLLKRLEGLL